MGGEDRGKGVWGYGEERMPPICKSGSGHEKSATKKKKIDFLKFSERKTDVLPNCRWIPRLDEEHDLFVIFFFFFFCCQRRSCPLQVDWLQQANRSTENNQRGVGNK